MEAQPCDVILTSYTPLLPAETLGSRKSTLSDVLSMVRLSA